MPRLIRKPPSYGLGKLSGSSGASLNGGDMDSPCTAPSPTAQTEDRLIADWLAMVAALPLRRR